MRITRVEALLLEFLLPERVFLSLAHSGTDRLGSMVVRIHTDEGIIGESLAGGQIHTVRDVLAPLLIGEDPFQIERLWKKMFDQTTTRDLYTPRRYDPSQILHGMSGLDIALWDLIGKAVGLPIARLWGQYRDEVPVYAHGGYYRQGRGIPELVREFVGYVELGYRTVKMKVGGLALDEDMERIRAVRRAIPIDVELIVDANTGWDFPTAVRATRLLENLPNIRWLEEPLHFYDDVEGLAQVAAATRIPIASGQTEPHKFGARTLLERGGIRIINFDCKAYCGFTEGRKIAHLAEARHVWVAPHHDFWTHVHLVASVPNGLILDSYPDPTRDPIWAELFKEKPKVADGMTRVPDAPGLGIVLDEAVVERHVVDRYSSD